MLNFFALRVRALVPFLLFVVVAVIAADARALVQATDVAVETVALADDARGDTIAPAPAPAPAANLETGRTSTERAVIDLAAAIEQTSVGTWLRSHVVAWNAIAAAALIAIGFAMKLVLQRVLQSVLARALERANKKRLSDAIAQSRVIVPISAIAPLLLVARMVGVLGEAEVLNPLVAFNVSNLCVAYAVLKGIGISSQLMKVVDDLYSARPEVNRAEALRGYRQVLMVVVLLAGGISAAAIAVGKSPVIFLAALGAVAAVLGVVFKDMLFSLVANLMLSANDAIRVGDWVELKQHSVDGRIAEIKTTAVRVQNADGTVHTVPIARFVQEPYLNYRSKYGSPVAPDTTSQVGDSRAGQPVGLRVAV